MRRYILTITCPDRIGIVAAVTGFIAGHGGSVLEAAQHGDLTSGLFFLRVEVTAESLPFGVEDFRTLFEPVATEFSMEWRILDTDVPVRWCFWSVGKTTVWPTCSTDGAAGTWSA